MKKLISVMLLASMLSLTACSTSEEKNSNTSGQSATIDKETSKPTIEGKSESFKDAQGNIITVPALTDDLFMEVPATTDIYTENMRKLFKELGNTSTEQMVNVYSIPAEERAALEIRDGEGNKYFEIIDVEFFPTSIEYDNDIGINLRVTNKGYNVGMPSIDMTLYVYDENDNFLFKSSQIINNVPIGDTIEETTHVEFDTQEDLDNALKHRENYKFKYIINKVNPNSVFWDATETEDGKALTAQETPTDILVGSDWSYSNRNGRDDKNEFQTQVICVDITKLKNDTNYLVLTSVKHNGCTNYYTKVTRKIENNDYLGYSELIGYKEEVEEDIESVKTVVMENANVWSVSAAYTTPFEKAEGKKVFELAYSEAENGVKSISNPQIYLKMQDTLYGLDIDYDNDIVTFKQLRTDKEVKDYVSFSSFQDDLQEGDKFELTIDLDKVKENVIAEGVPQELIDTLEISTSTCVYFA